MFQVALASTLRGSNPSSYACLIAMDYGRESIVRNDWKKIFEDGELEEVSGNWRKPRLVTVIEHRLL